MTMRIAFRPLAAAIASAAILAAIACSSTNEDTADGGASPDGGGVVAEQTKVRVTAAAGGTVADPAGKASLAIPAGALATDTDITLDIRAKETGTESEVFEFGPTGTQFTKPAALTLKFAGTVPDGKKAVLAVQEGTKWTPIEGSAAANGVVSGNITHFSKFTIIFVDGKILAVSSCAEQVTGFVACGGDPKGNWAFQDYCFKDPKQLGEAPGNCPEARVENDVDLMQDVTINDTTITLAGGTRTLNQKFHIPISCLTDAGGVTCADLQNAFFKKSDGGVNGTCVAATEANTCDCSRSESQAQPGGSVQYTVSGNAMTINGDPAEYCVSGDTLKIYVEKGTDDEAVYVLKKK